jgi:hypothetical protein
VEMRLVDGGALSHEVCDKDARQPEKVST